MLSAPSRTFLLQLLGAVVALTTCTSKPCPYQSHPAPTALPAGPLPKPIQAALDKLDTQWTEYVQKASVPSVALSVVYDQQTIFFGVGPPCSVHLLAVCTVCGV